MSYVGRSDAERAHMLAAVGAKRFEDLLVDVPDGLRIHGPLDVPAAASEIELRAEVGALAAKNDAAREVPSFLGGGMYDHYIPSALPRVALRSEFMTAYTPYQPEVAQGTLQVIFEFQSMIAELTGLDMANASLYDGASATVEAAYLARAHTGRSRVVVAGALHPHYRATLVTFLGTDAVRHVAHDPATGLDAHAVAQLPVTVVDSAIMRELLSILFAPSVLVTAAAGLADQPIPLDITPVLAGVDVSGELLVAIGNLPTGALLSAGAAAPDGALSARRNRSVSGKVPGGGR
jgi:glycine dehydrogenase subunit 1